MIKMIPFGVLQISLLIMWWILWMFWARLSKGVRHFCVLLGLIFFAGWAYFAYNYYWPHAIVTAESAQLYIGPDASYPVRATLSQDERVAVEQKKDGWYYVSSFQGKGWMKADTIVVESSVA